MMTPYMLATLVILVAAIILFVTEKLRVDVVALGVVISLMLTGVLSTNEALAGFKQRRPDYCLIVHRWWGRFANGPRRHDR